MGKSISLLNTASFPIAPSYCLCLTYSETVSGLTKPQRKNWSGAQALPCCVSLSVLLQPYYALCCTLSSVCKTQWASSSSTSLCLFLAFIPFWIIASIPCCTYLLFLVFTEMHFCTVNICPSLLTCNHSCPLSGFFLFSFLSVTLYLFLVMSMHILVHLPGTTYWPAAQPGMHCSTRGFSNKTQQEQLAEKQSKDLDALFRGKRVQLAFLSVPSILLRPHLQLRNGRSHRWTDAVKRVFA